MTKIIEYPGFTVEAEPNVIEVNINCPQMIIMVPGIHLWLLHNMNINMVVSYWDLLIRFKGHLEKM